MNKNTTYPQTLGIVVSDSGMVTAGRISEDEDEARASAYEVARADKSGRIDCMTGEQRHYACYLIRIPELPIPHTPQENEIVISIPKP